MTDETKISIKNFSFATMIVIVMGVSTSIAFVGRTEYRIAQLEESKKERREFFEEVIKSYDSQQVEKLKRIEEKIISSQEEVRILRAEIRQVYNLLLAESKK